MVVMGGVAVMKVRCGSDGRRGMAMIRGRRGSSWREEETVLYTSTFLHPQHSKHNALMPPIPQPPTLRSTPPSPAVQMWQEE